MEGGQAAGLLVVVFFNIKLSRLLVTHELTCTEPFRSSQGFDTQKKRLGRHPVADDENGDNPTLPSESGWMSPTMEDLCVWISRYSRETRVFSFSFRAGLHR